MKIFALIAHNDGAMLSDDCRLFTDKASAYNAMLSDIHETFCDGNPMSDEDFRREFEEHDGNLDTDSADVEYFGITYEWKIQECDMPEKKDSMSHKIAETVQNWSAPAEARDKQTDELDVVTQALKNLNIKWCQEDLESVLEDADIPVTQGNLERLCKQITDGFHEILIEETNERLQFLALDMTAKEKKAKEKKAAEKGDSCTRAWKVYGREGQPQHKSFSESHTYDFSDEYDGTRIISVLNSDKTETNDYTIIKIIRNTREECARELDGQLSDGVFENSDVGKVVEIDPADLPQSEN